MKRIPSSRYQNILERIFQNLLSGQSTLIAGGMNSGKTSLLKDVNSIEVREEYLSDPGKFMYLYLDFKTLSSNISFIDFWRLVFEQLVRLPGLEPKFQQLAQEEFISADEFDSFSLESFFEDIYKIESRLVLLLDHTEYLLGFTQDTVHGILSSFRGISSLTRGLVIIFASRLRATELNNRTAYLNPRGSPYFNTYREILTNDTEAFQTL